MDTLQEKVASIVLQMAERRENAAQIAIYEYDLQGHPERLCFVRRPDAYHVGQYSGRISVTDLCIGERRIWSQWIEVRGMTLTVTEQWFDDKNGGE